MSVVLTEVLMSLPVGTITHNSYHCDATAGLGDGNDITIKRFGFVLYQERISLWQIFFFETDVI